jgi:SAM-dependent methyltransferase
MKLAKPNFTYRHFERYDNAIAELKQTVGNLSNKRVLEAGCGSGSYLDLSGAFVVGVDISQHQLDRNETLKEKYCADLHVFEKPEWEKSFDAIICWDVVEHLDNPKIAIAKFLKWLKSDGRLILAYPNPQTLKGMATKYTPYFIHQLFYKLASGTPFSASKVDKGPFRTVFAPELKFQNLLQLLSENQCRINALYSVESYQNRFVKRYATSAVIDSLDKFFMGDLYPALHHSATDFVMVITPEPAVANRIQREKTASETVEKS